MKTPDGRCIICKHPGYTRTGTTLKFANAKPLHLEKIHLYAFRMKERRGIVLHVCAYCLRDLKEAVVLPTLQNI